MKALKVSFAVLVAVLMAMGVATQAQAFHSGGVAECEGCHSMHNSFEDSANVTGLAQFQSGPYLLKAQDQSGACLNCHQSPDVAPTGYHISTAGITQKDSTSPVELTPGGDFAWLKKTMTGSVRKTLTEWEGDRHGHNIIAVDFGYTQDKIITKAPGGAYPADKLACSSCHDPHGRYRRDASGVIATTGLPIFNSGSYTNSKDPIANVSAVGVYRLLAGKNYQPKSTPGYAFLNDPPAAIAQSTYNATATSLTAPGAAQPDLVAYGSGMSEWCANCHTGILLADTYTSGMKGLRHPAGSKGVLTADIATNYGKYISTGNMGGTGANFSALAPFEIGSADYGVLKTFPGAPTAATTTNNVACVSCHRSHASAFESMVRYYLGSEFMTVADASNAGAYDSSTTDNKINTGYTVTQQQMAYNGRLGSVFGPYARNYCNKCHAKD